MRRRSSLLAVAVAALLSATTGCFSARPSARDTFTALGLRNATQQPVRVLDHNLFVKMTKKRAHEAWAEIVAAQPDPCFSRYHASGFEAGFMDYVEAGGDGEPHSIPPFLYRQAWLQDGRGPSAIEDYYAGFRHGSAVARTTGLREQYLIPLPGPLNAPTIASSSADRMAAGYPPVGSGSTALPLPVDIPVAPQPRVLPTDPKPHGKPEVKPMPPPAKPASVPAPLARGAEPVTPHAFRPVVVPSLVKLWSKAFSVD